MPLLNIDAVIFDLDGVITDSAKVHAVAWKTLFDEYLGLRAKRYREAFQSFALPEDYIRYIDGKPRYDGVRSFLLSRGIRIPDGDPRAGPNDETICGLGNKKDCIFNNILDQNGVEVFHSSISLVRELQAIGVCRGLVSSSKNCRRVLQITGIEGLFGVRVDGIMSAELGLKGKPAPDIFLKCAELLGVSPKRSVVVEDAISGVQAGRAGNFGLVIGIDRVGLGGILGKNGADVVVPDLLYVSPDDMDKWFLNKQRALSCG